MTSRPARAIGETGTLLASTPGVVRAVLFDRDGTLVANVPYLRDPEQIRVCEGAFEAVTRARSAGLSVGVVTNQSGIGRSFVTWRELELLHAEIERQIGAIDTWQVCPHAPWEHCACRKPEPMLVWRAARALGLRPHQCVVLGDRLSDVEAAHRAGATGILVPSADTPQSEREAAPVVVSCLTYAVELVVRGRDCQRGAQHLPGPKVAGR